MQIEQIIFDCDGVLVDSEIVAAEVMVPVLKSLGQIIEIPYYLSNYSGKTFRTIFNDIDIDTRIDIDLLIKNIEERVYRDIKAVEGIANVIKGLNLPMAVVSNSSMDQINTALTATNLGLHFNDLFSSNMVKNPKPSSDIYLYAAKKLSRNVKECLVIEDSKSGVTAALGAGMHVIGFCGGKHILKSHADELKELGVHYVAHNAIELQSIIGSII
jgi:HAD superfamily hydrolase (TIGR01509 family)